MWNKLDTCLAWVSEFNIVQCMCLMTRIRGVGKLQKRYYWAVQSKPGAGIGNRYSILYSVYWKKEEKWLHGCVYIGLYECKKC